VAENHQYHNAKSLSENNAAILIEDKKLKNDLAKSVVELIKSETKLSELQKNALKLAKPDAAKVIAQNAINFAEAV
jgi:UDP-N-acetylglucosamine--N-acetylmuramyl-(pentapeptide) pyrophosphoryl-undecaprenol N-acetylglucosamine transferase